MPTNTAPATTSIAIATPPPRSTAVEGLLAEVFEPQRRVVGPAADLGGDAGVDHLADEDRVVAHLDRARQPALDEGRHRGQDRRAGAAAAIGLAVDAIAVAHRGLEEGEGGGLLAFAEHVEGEGARRLDHRVGAR